MTWLLGTKHSNILQMWLNLQKQIMTKGRGQKGTCAPQTQKPSVPLEQVLKTLVYFQMNLIAIPSIC